MYSKVLAWGKLIAITGSAQVIIQALGFVGGILVIRLLPTHEYALYTLANTMLGTMTVLADGGISAGVMAQGGKVWQDKGKLGAVLVTGLDLRKKFAVASLVISVPVLFLLLRHHNASWLMTGLVVISIVPAFYSGLSSTIFQLPLKLRQDIAPLQKNQVLSSVARLVLLTLTMFIFPWSFIAVLASGIPQIWANIRLQKISSVYADWSQSPDDEVKKDVIYVVKRLLPGALYYCLSGQISIWLISLFGSTEAVAQIGALGRLAMMLALFNILFNTLITPRFARLSGEKMVLLKRFIYYHLGLMLLTVAMLAFVWKMPAEILWVLGKDYANLEKELFLSIMGACINLIAGLSFALLTSRGFAINPFISIPVSLVSVVFGVTVMEVSSIQGVLWFNIFISSIQLLMNSAYGCLKLFQIKVLS